VPAGGKGTTIDRFVVRVSNAADQVLFHVASFGGR
jgi:hypothetical protein